jgi:hypothetical protein
MRWWEVKVSIDKSAGKPICTANAARRVRHRDVSNDKSAGKPICTANAAHKLRHWDVSNAHTLVIQKKAQSPESKK